MKTECITRMYNFPTRSGFPMFLTFGFHLKNVQHNLSLFQKFQINRYSYFKLSKGKVKKFTENRSFKKKKNNNIVDSKDF